MKSSVLIAIAMLTPISMPAADAPGYQSESQAVSEIFTSRITKIYAAREGAHEFVAYVIMWKDHEVIVTPPPYINRQFDSLAVGDIIRCEMRQSYAPAANGGGTARMTFTMVGRPGDPASAAGFVPGAANDAARMEAVSAEVARRRAYREAAPNVPQPNSPRPAPAAPPTPRP